MLEGGSHFSSNISLSFRPYLSRLLSLESSLPSNYAYNKCYFMVIDYLFLMMPHNIHHFWILQKKKLADSLQNAACNATA